MSTTAGAKSKTSGQASRELKSVGHKKVGGGILQERSGSQLNKKTSTPTSSGKKQQSLFGFKGFAQISKESNKTFSVFNDENAVSKSDKKSDNLTDRDSQTDITGDYASVVGDGDLAFYKELAERRREALNDSLKENESLVSENAELRHRNYELNNENQSLQESVEKANNLAKMLEPLFSNIDDDGEDSTSGSPEEAGEGDGVIPSSSQQEEENPKDGEAAANDEPKEVVDDDETAREGGTAEDDGHEQKQDNK